MKRLAKCVYAGKKLECINDFSGLRFTSSDGHKLLIWDDVAGEWCWKKANAIQPHDWIVFKQKRKQNPHKKYPIQFAWFLGYMLGNGYLSRPEKKQYTVTVATGYDKACAKKCLTIFNVIGKIDVKKKDKQLVVVWYRKDIRDLLSSLLHRDEHIRSKGRDGVLLKRVPRYMYTATLQEKQAFLAGVIDSDGSLDKQGRVSISSKHSIVISDLQRLFSSVGILSRIDRRRQNKPNTFCSCSCWSSVLHVSNYDTHKLCLDKFLVSYKKKRIAAKLKNIVANDARSFPPQLAKILYLQWKEKTGYKLPSSAKRKEFTPFVHLVRKISSSRGCGHTTARIFGFSPDYLLLKFSRRWHGKIVKMYDMSILNSTDKRIVTDGVITHNSDLVLELIAPEGRDSDHRILTILKGRNCGYADVALNMKMSPRIDLSEMLHSKNTLRLMKPKEPEIDL